MAFPPLSIRVRRQAGVVELQWAHGTYCLPFRFLRGRCPCACCVNEVSGVRVVDVEDVPIAIAPTNIQFSGNYAIKITWSDRHDTGLFTWEYLELLSRDSATEEASHT